MGAMAQGIQWPEDFIQRLVDQGRFVIRYDHRDTGQSTCFDFTEQPYTLDDLANDAIGVLDAYHLPSTHVVGASMGGMIVQLLMLQHRPRIKTATIIMSSPLAIGSVVPKLAADDLPGPSAEFVAKGTATQPVPTDTRATKIQETVRHVRDAVGLRGTVRRKAVPRASPSGSSTAQRLSTR